MEDQAPGPGKPLRRAALLLPLLLGAGVVLSPLLGAVARPRELEAGPPAPLAPPRAEARARYAGAEPLGLRGPASEAGGGLAEGLSLLIAERGRASALAARLRPERLGGLGEEEIAGILAEYFEAAERGSLEPGRGLGPALPAPAAASSLIASDRDLEDFKASARGRGEAAAHYAEMASLVPEMRPLRARYELILGTAYERQAGRGSPGASRRLGLPSRKGEIYPPSRKSLDYVHPYALDIFFVSVERFAGGVERGPEVLSVAPGIVLAAAGDWRGEAGHASYREGGFSPNSGNGVIAYEPRTRRFYSYFHLSEVAVRAGDILEAGTVLGRGGDTGSNARKDGHGGHVHLEIFDAQRGRPLPAREIRDLLFGK